MNIKDLANAVERVEEDKFIKKIDKEFERLNQLRFSLKIISLVKDLTNYMVPKYLYHTFKCTIEELNTYPSKSWGLVYSVGSTKGKVQINEHDLDKLFQGLQSIRDNQLVELAKTGFIVEYNFESKLLTMLLGQKFCSEYLEYAIELETI